MQKFVLLFVFWFVLFTQIAQSNVGKRTPAEFERQMGLVLNWVDNGLGDPTQLIQAQIIKNSQFFGQIFVITADPATTRHLLETEYNVTNLSNCQFIDDTCNWPWTRDYIPQTVYSSYTSNPSLVYWMKNDVWPTNPEDKCAIKYAQHVGYKFIPADNPYFKLQGGNFMTDGLGTAFSLDDVMQQNKGLDVSSALRSLNGIDRYITLPTPHIVYPKHIDMVMKMIDEETIMVLDSKNNWLLKKEIQSMVDLIQANYLNVYNRPYRIIWIPSYKINTALAYMESYVNFTTFNGICLVPIFGNATHDALATKIIKEALPGRTVWPIDSRELVSLSGQIHCLTNQVGYPNSIVIKHPRLFDKAIAPTRGTSGKYQFLKQKKGNGYLVTADITSAGPWKLPTLDYNFSGQSESVLMSKFSNGVFAAKIPHLGQGSICKYRISTTGINGVKFKHPCVGFHEFTVIDVDPCSDQNYAGGQRRKLRIPRGLFKRHAENFASAVGVTIDPGVSFSESLVQIEAPSVDYSAKVGTTDQLFLTNTEMSITSQRLSLSKLLLGQGAFPDPNQKDTSVFYADACEMDPIENWRLAKGTQAAVSCQSDITIGVPELAGKQDAMVCNEEVTLALESFNDINVHQAIGILPTILEQPAKVTLQARTGGVRFNPAATNSIMQMQIAGGLMVSGYEASMNNVTATLSQKSWLHVQAKEMKLAGTNINLSDVVQDRTTIPLNFDAWKFKVEPSIDNYPFAIRESERLQLLFGGGTSGEHVHIEVFNASLDVPHHVKQTTIQNSNSSLECTISASALDLKSSYIKMGPDQSLNITAENILFSPNARLEADKDAQISIKALSGSDAKNLIAHFVKNNSVKETLSKAIPSSPAANDTSITEDNTVKTMADSSRIEPLDIDNVSIYPNPFNPVTTIAYHLDSPGYVEIQVYDLLGRHVTTLMQAHQDAGSYKNQWNGSSHSSGVYFVRVIHREDITGKVHTYSLKMNLLK